MDPIPTRRGLPASAVLTHAESLILETDLTPTDYALAWAMTHYLARKRGPEFVNYLRSMSQLAPMQPRTPDQHLAEFRKFFGDDLSRLDKKIDEYIRKLSGKKGYDPLPYYAVMFEQGLNNGTINRAVMVSQSPQIIQQWVYDHTSPHGDVPNWEAIPLPTRARADVTAMQWMRGDEMCATWPASATRFRLTRTAPADLSIRTHSSWHQGPTISAGLDGLATTLSTEAETALPLCSVTWL